MSMQPQNPLPSHTSIELPPDLAGGIHADAASVWHTAESFVIDFLALKAPPQMTDVDGVATIVSQLAITSRVRMAPTHVIELMKALEQQLTMWETETGQRPPVESPHPDL